MKKPFFSFLMPVYNAEKTLDRAIASVCKQTADEWELICCNDGSTDNSLEILQKYAAQDSRIKVICNEENLGGLRTRNRLIREFSGEYCAWLDADDEYANAFLETAKNHIENGNWDIVVFPVEECFSDGRVQINPGWQRFSCRGENMLEPFFNRLPFRWGLWSKVIRGSIMKKVSAPDMKLWPDDMFLTLQVYYYAKSCICDCLKPMYRYYAGTGYWSSITQNVTLERYRKTCETYRQILEYNFSFCNMHDVKISREELLSVLDVGNMLWIALSIENLSDRQAAFIEFQKYFGLSLHPRQYNMTFYPAGCEPKKVSYSFVNPQMKF